jgi:hypothetical protein
MRYSASYVSPHTTSLHDCLLVSRSWCHSARPLLCSNVVLSTPQGVTKFCRQFNFAHHGSLVKSLTFRSLQRYNVLIAPDNSWNSRSVDPSELINLLASVVGRLSELRTFSVLVSLNTYGFHGLKPSALADLVDALPESCVNLEIEPRYYDRRTEDTTHLCERLRHVLPRMQHFRLCSPHICSALLGDGPPLPVESENFWPISLPNIRTLVLNIEALADGSHEWRCVAVSGTLFHTSNRTARGSIIPALQQLVECGSYPSSAKLYVLDHLDYGRSHFRISYNMILRVEMTTKTAWAVPFGSIVVAQPNNYRPHFVRTLDDRELIFSDGPAFQPRESLTGWEDWKSLLGCGARLPASLVTLPTENLTLPSSSEWRLEWSKASCRLWKLKRGKGRKRTCPGIRFAKPQHIYRRMLFIASISNFWTSCHLLLPPLGLALHLFAADWSTLTPGAFDGTS